MYESQKPQQKKKAAPIIKVAAVQVVRRCPHCGIVLYEKLGRCDGNIKIKCQKCGRLVSMNLALRRIQH